MAVIISAARTAVGNFGGSLAKVSAPALGSTVIKAVLERGGVDGAQIDEVIMGNVLTAGLGQNPARQAAMGAGLPQEVPAMTIDKVCGSGLKAVMLAAQAIKCGDASLVVAGGQENMSATSHVVEGSRDGQRMGDWKMKDTMINDGLWCAFGTPTPTRRRASRLRVGCECQSTQLLTPSDPSGSSGVRSTTTTWASPPRTSPTSTR